MTRIRFQLPSAGVAVDVEDPEEEDCWLEELPCPVEPVSYTHLDVYKRQLRYPSRIPVVNKVAQIKKISR